ncbi:PREDICTED: cyclin-SDS [Ipomoea nil]|uniref:cyclin-SDS n=1 Tax=Ipomoea nil TaxID=35883 RepID=UPI000900E6A8|nr:PREDICTED: cyclin-SDS [Ipomoea nil]
MKRKQSRGAVAEIDPPPPPPPQLQQQLNFAVKKHLRSKLPRRIRTHFSPILRSLFIAPSALVTSEASSVIEKKDVQMELSECSCVESNSGAFGGDSELKLKFKLKKSGNANVIEDPDAVVQSEISSVERFSLSGKARKPNSEIVSVTEKAKEIDESEISSQRKFSGKVSEFSEWKVKRSKDASEMNDNDVVSINSALESAAESKLAENRAFGEEVSKPESAAHKVLTTDFDLECSENLSINDEVFDDYSSAYSELQSDILQESSDLDFSDYSPSMWYDSGSQFSEKSIGDDCPSHSFHLSRQFSEEFCRSTYAPDDSSYPEEHNISDEISLELEEEDGERYRMLRSRERRQVYLRDYAEEYCLDTGYGDLVVQQRLQMVHWIVQQSSKNELQKETMFLGVNLFDRFLTKGYFRNKKNLQIAGIACLTLATRIEENQPLNSIQDDTFNIGGNVYSRCEVVAMEWVVLEVLNFQCFLPTIYNFLWFYLKAARASDMMEKRTKYLAVLALLGHEQLSYWPSTVAAGLVILASSFIDQHASCDLFTECHSRTKDDDLPKCIKSLEWLVKYI